MDLMTASATVVFCGVNINDPIQGRLVLLSHRTAQSNVFTTGSHYWSAGIAWRILDVNNNQPCLSMDLKLWTGGAKVKVSVELSLIDTRCSMPPSILYSSLPRDFVASEQTPRILNWEVNDAFLCDQCSWYVDPHGRIVFQVTVTVLPEEDDDRPETTTSTTLGKQIDGDDKVPPSDMLDQLGEVLETRVGADVTFSVDGELFPAHKIVLAMRSRVFKALLFGEMKESGEPAPHIEIGGMTAETFRALLRYVYTDASPASSNQEEEECCQGDNNTNKVWELLTAADLYSVERLKLICERVLCKRLEVDNVAEMLGLADQHNCRTLKDACIEFMITSHRMEQVQKTQGYLKLRELHPLLLVEVLEKSSKF